MASVDIQKIKRKRKIATRSVKHSMSTVLEKDAGALG